MPLSRSVVAAEHHNETTDGTFVLEGIKSGSNHHEISAFATSAAGIVEERARIVIENPEIDYDLIPLPTVATAGTLTFQASKGVGYPFEDIIDPVTNSPVFISIAAPLSFIFEAYIQDLQVTVVGANGPLEVYNQQAW